MKHERNVESGIRQRSTLVTLASSAIVGLAIGSGGAVIHDRFRGDEASPDASFMVTEKALEEKITPNATTNFVAYRLKPRQEATNQLSDEQIRHRFNLAAKYIAFTFDNHYDLQLTDIENVAVTPGDEEKSDRTPCYAEDQIDDISRALRQRTKDEFGEAANFQIISNTYGTCNDGRKSRSNSNSAAFAADNFTYYDQNYENKSNYTSSNMLHELGHQLGLTHFPRVDCEDGATTYVPVHNSVENIDGLYASGTAPLDHQPTCDVARDANGAINVYSAEGSVMGLNDSVGKRRFSRTIPPYLNLDRIATLPDVYTVATAPAIPASYELNYGENKVNGVEFELPSDHPLKSLDNRLTKLVVTIEAIGADSSGDSSPYDCKNRDYCRLDVAATNDDFSLRYQLDDARCAVSQPGALPITSLLYVDPTLGIALVQEDQRGVSTKLNVIEYKGTPLQTTPLECRGIGPYRQASLEDARNSSPKNLNTVQ